MLEKPNNTVPESHLEQKSKLTLIREKIDKYLQYMALLAVMNGLYSDTPRHSEGQNESENVQIEQSIDTELRSIQQEVGVEYIPQVSNEQGPLIIEIAQRHAATGRVVMKEGENIKDCVNSQKKIEGVVLRLLKYAKEHNLKIHFFEDGNYFESSPMTGTDPSNTIEAFLTGVITEDYLNEDIRLFGYEKISDFERNSGRYGYWKGVIRYLDNNKNIGDIETREKLRKRAEKNLANINMDFVYNDGAVIKLIHDGVINREDYKRSEDKDALDNCFKVMFGNSEPLLGYTNVDIQKNFDLSKLSEAMEVREDIAVDLMSKDFEKDHSDLNVAIYGAAHDFKNNVVKHNTRTGQKIGLVRIATEPSDGGEVKKTLNEFQKKSSN